MRLDLNDVITRAFVAGFYHSSDGFNAVYPFDMDTRRIENALMEEINVTIDEITTSLNVEDE